MFGLKQAKMGKMKMCEGGEVDEGGYYSNEVKKSFSHHLHQNYHHASSNTNYHHLPVVSMSSPVSSPSLLSGNGVCCNSSEDGSSSSPSFTTLFGGESYDPTLFNFNQPLNVSNARVSNSLFFGNSNVGSTESDLSEMLFDKLHIEDARRDCFSDGVKGYNFDSSCFGNVFDKHKSSNSSADFRQFVEKNQDVFAPHEYFSDGVCGNNVDKSYFGNVFDNGVNDFSGYSKRFDSRRHLNTVFPNPVYPQDHMSNLAGARFEKETGYQGFYPSMMQQCGLDSSQVWRQRMGRFMENIPTPIPSVKLNPSLSSASERVEGLDFEDSFILQGTNLNYNVDKGSNRPKSRKKKEKRTKRDIGLNLEGLCENDIKSRSFGAFSFEANHSLLDGVQGFIYYMAKDQCGCRFLQKIIDEGSIQDVQTILIEIIDHVVELMTDQFGNYFMQKLLDVCSEEQRMQIVSMVTERPGVLVSLCLNPHGTRAVQKLIETLKTRQQISLVIHALEPGFLDLMKDVNGNHVVQRCLQCLSYDDYKFIFSAAAKYCVDIATHQHGCCVLNRCIAHATGKDQEKLVNEISANGFHLAQDPYGNYVIQYIIELKIPFAAATLLSQFEGSYVYLSMQKFSSHVVEKCLKHVEQSRSRIIHEFLSVPHFDQLLQDPFANYVVQSALEVTKGPLHSALVEAVEPHLILRTSPFCKKIFSRNLLKK